MYMKVFTCTMRNGGKPLKNGKVGENGKNGPKTQSPRATAEDDKYEMEDDLEHS